MRIDSSMELVCGSGGECWWGGRGGVLNWFGCHERRDELRSTIVQTTPVMNHYEEDYTTKRCTYKGTYVVSKCCQYRISGCGVRCGMRYMHLWCCRLWVCGLARSSIRSRSRSTHIRPCATRQVSWGRSLTSTQGHPSTPDPTHSHQLGAVQCSRHSSHLIVGTYNWSCGVSILWK